MKYSTVVFHFITSYIHLLIEQQGNVIISSHGDHVSATKSLLRIMHCRCSSIPRYPNDAIKYFIFVLVSFLVGCTVLFSLH